VPSIREPKLIPGCTAVLASLCMLAGCGGGGGGDDGAPTPPPPPPPPPATYSLTATVSGLTGAGLVLQNNGAGNVAVASGATTVSIASGVASGTGYAVTVLTQPAGQTCAVTNGSGSLTANVSNVAITCTTPPAPAYTVGGTITGLTGTGLSLRLNNQAGASYNTSPAAGAVTFGFTQTLATGDAYNVGIRVHPTNPAQICTLASGAGTIGSANVSNVAITCTNSTPFTVGGTVTGLTGTGLSLQMGYRGASTPANLAIAANGGFTFTQTIDAPGFFGVNVGSQPTGQACTVTRGKGVSAVNITDVVVTCTNNPPSALRGTYTLFGPAPIERYYLNFNADGTLTVASMQNEDDCGTRDGNGVEYGLFTWNQTTSAFTPVAAAVDTNGGCGVYDDENFADSFRGTLTRTGNSLIITDGAEVFGTATAVESTPGTLVGGFVTQGNGVLLVLHSDGTFLFAETQSRLPGPASGQERGCYTISGAEITFNIQAACRPDGVAASDLNGPYGIFQAGMTAGPMPFTIDDANTVTIGGVVYKRTQPN
jgi:hypothetical protein